VSERCLRCGGEMSTGHKCLSERVDPPFPINLRVPVGAQWVTLTFSATAGGELDELRAKIEQQERELIEKQQYILRLERGR